MPILKNGFPTTLEIGVGEASVELGIREKSVTPPGATMGGPIDTAHMRLNLYRSRWPKSLITLKPMKVTASGSGNATYFDLLDAITGILGANLLMAVTFADGHGIRFWGFVDDAEPSEHKEGEQPTWTLTIEPTMEDNAGNEVFVVTF